MAKTQFTSPVGRMVFGSVWDGSTTDSKGNPRIVKSGPNKGAPSTQWSFGVAFPKLLSNGAPNAEFNAFAAMIHDAGRTGYPQYYTGPIDPLTGKPGIANGVVFATKIKDGDGIDQKGQQNNQKEGWAGHWIVVFSTQYAPRVFDVNIGLDPTQQLQDKTRVLPGDYIAVNGTVEANIGSETPGVYVNGNMVCLVGGGQRIVSGPKAAEAFKGVTAGALPAGCVPGANPSNLAPATPVPNVSMPAVPVPVAPAVPVPPVAPTPPAPVVPSAPQLTPAAIAAGFTTYQAAIAANWTDDLLRSHGYLAAAPVAPTPPAPVAPTPPAPVAPTPPAITLTAAAIAAGYTLDSFTAAGFTYDMMKQGGWAV